MTNKVRMQCTDKYTEHQKKLITSFFRASLVKFDCIEVNNFLDSDIYAIIVLLIKYINRFGLPVPEWRKCRGIMKTAL